MAEKTPSAPPSEEKPIGFNLSEFNSTTILTEKQKLEDEEDYNPFVHRVVEKPNSLAQTAQILIALAILFTFGLQFYVPMDILWRKLEHRIPKEKHNISQIAIRTGIILICSAVAAAVPNLEPFIGLVGALFFSTLGLLVPAVVETIFKWPDNLGPLKLILVKNIIVGIFAIFALVSGSIVSISEIVEIYRGEEH
uniref:Amino acid transporter transmembrane domain-containing protein n=1 Tax=Phlebotomus papatasi TaxID=29031 RepID=A0A1B0D2Z8_PHLPP